MTYQCPLLKDPTVCAYLKQRKKENQHKTPTSTIEIKDVTTAVVGVLPIRPVTRSQTSPPTKQSVPTALDTDWVAQERLRDQMMREGRQLQNELEEPTSAPSITPSGDTTPLEWDPKALPQHDDMVSDTQPNHPTETLGTTELSHRVLESIQNHKLQVTMRDLFSLSPSLTEFVRSRLTEAVTQPSRTPTTEELIAATEAIDKHMPVISICIGKNIVDDLLDGGSGVNVITEEERRKLGLPKPSPAYQRIINQIFKDYLNDFMKLFLDDFNVYSDVATHLPKLRLVFERCRQYGVSLNPDKCIFYVLSGVILGYIVCQVGKFPDPKKIEALVKMPPPKNVKAIQTFNGLAQFNQCFIKDYVGIMEPITQLTRKGEVFDWTTKCKHAYQYIKTRYQNAPILIGVDWKLEFHVHTDASDIAVGAMLAKNPTGKTDQPIAYASCLLTKAEKKYTTTEKEALAMVYAVNKFRHYLLGSRFIFFVDHLALQYLVNKPQVSGRLARWLLLFLEFDFKVIYKPGKTHGVADALSRNERAEPATGIPNQTTDAQLFSIQTDWTQPIIDYLQTGKFSPSMTKEACKRLAYRAIPFQVIQGKLYRLGKDLRLRQVISDSQARMIL